MRFARLINASFLKSGLTEMKELDSENEAMYLLDVASGSIVSIIVFGRYDTSMYYIPVVWTSPRHRGEGCYERLLTWMKSYVRSKGATSIDTDVHYDNHKMIRMMEKHWKKSFVRFSCSLTGKH